MLGCASWLNFKGVSMNDKYDVLSDFDNKTIALKALKKRAKKEVGLADEIKSLEISREIEKIKYADILRDRQVEKSK